MALSAGVKRLKTPTQALAKPLTVPSFLKGTGVAYNEAKRVTGVRGVGPDKARLFQFLKPRAYSAIGLDFLDKPLKSVALLLNVNTT